jgi:hypothetical protein
VPGEDKSPFNITTARAHEGMVLEAGHRHGVVLSYLSQAHLDAARQAPHLH